VESVRRSGSCSSWCIATVFASKSWLTPFWIFRESRPAGFTPKENPFYVALPYGEFEEDNSLKHAARSVPWYRPGVSPLLKNRWVEIRRGEQSCFAQWEDVGPCNEDDFDYVFGEAATPLNSFDAKAGLDVSPAVWHHLGMTDNGITLIKYWLEVSNKEQKERFEARVEDPMRQWKLSNMDLPSRERWYDYSRARDKMLEATDTDFAPWYLIHSDDKRRARLNLISHFLGLFPYEASPEKKVKLPTRDKSKAYDDEATIKDRRWIKEKY